MTTNQKNLSAEQVKSIISKIFKNDNQIDNHREFGTEDWMDRYLCDLASAERLIAKFNDRLSK